MKTSDLFLVLCDVQRNGLQHSQNTMSKFSYNSIYYFEVNMSFMCYPRFTGNDPLLKTTSVALLFLQLLMLRKINPTFLQAL